MRKIPFDIHLLAPRHWPALVALGVLRILVFLPYPVLLVFGKVFGRAIPYLLPYRKNVVKTNLRLCFPKLDEKQRKYLLERHFESLGMGFFEMAACWWAPDSRLKGRADIVGLKHISQALEKGKGVILLTGHFTSFEIAGRFLAKCQSMCVTYREFRNPVFNYFMVHARRKRFTEAIPRGDTRSFVRALKRNQVVWYAPDQDPGRRHSVFIPFFNTLAATLTATGRFVGITGAAVLPFSVRRLPGVAEYRLIIHPPLPEYPTGNAENDAKQINAFLEDRILEAPEQYFWIHRRFKTRPIGESKLYPSKPRRIKKHRNSVA